MPDIAGGANRRWRNRIWNNRGVRTDGHLDIQNRDGRRKIETVGDPVGHIDRVLMNREIKVV